jgi:hypothetical protein
VQHITYKTYQAKLVVGLEGLPTLEFVGQSLPIKLTMLITYLLEFLIFINNKVHLKKLHYT